MFHVFGNLDVPDSLLITEDDYFDFLIGVTDDASLIPLPVRSALADSALLFLGFGLEQWDVRILLRGLVSQEGAHKLQRYTHVAAQIDLSDTVMSPARARRYMEKYFTKFRQPSIDIFWGSVDEFASGLAAMGRPLMTDVSDHGAAPSRAHGATLTSGPARSATASRSTAATREIHELRDAIVAERIVLLYSPSGAGKTSLLEAGLRPELEAPRLRRPADHPRQPRGPERARRRGRQPLRAEHDPVPGGGPAAGAAAERRRAGRHRPPRPTSSGSAPTCHRGSTPACSSTSSRSCSPSTPPTSTRRPSS